MTGVAVADAMRHARCTLHATRRLRTSPSYIYGRMTNALRSRSICPQVSIGVLPKGIENPAPEEEGKGVLHYVLAWGSRAHELPSPRLILFDASGTLTSPKDPFKSPTFFRCGPKLFLFLEPTDLKKTRQALLPFCG